MPLYNKYSYIRIRHCDTEMTHEWVDLYVNRYNRFGVEYPVIFVYTHNICINMYAFVRLKIIFIRD